MAERFVLAVYVGEEVFGALGQVEYGTQVDYLRTRLGNRWGNDCASSLMYLVSFSTSECMCFIVFSKDSR